MNIVIRNKTGNAYKAMYLLTGAKTGTEQFKVLCINLSYCLICLASYVISNYSGGIL